MRQINTVNRLCKEAHRAKVGHVYGVVANYPIHDMGVTVAPITPRAVESWPSLKRKVAFRLGVALGRSPAR